MSLSGMKWTMVVVVVVVLITIRDSNIEVSTSRQDELRKRPAWKTSQVFKNKYKKYRKRRGIIDVYELKW